MRIVIESEGGGGGLLGREDTGEGGGRRTQQHGPTSSGMSTPEQLEEYCGSSGDAYAQIVFVSAHPTSSS